MKKLLLSLVMVYLITLGNIAQAQAPVPPVIPRDMSVKGVITYWADKYSVSAEKMEKTIKCESHFNTAATNITKREHSVGSSQINLLAHPEVTETQARDFDWATEYMAKQFSLGNAKIWTCYK